MSFEFYVWGEIGFPSAADIPHWKKTVVDPRRHHDWDDYFSGMSATSELTVAEVFEEYCDCTTSDGSMCYFLSVASTGKKVQVLGLVHRDGFDRLFLAAFRCAADVGGRGTLFFENSMGDDETYALDLGAKETRFGESKNDVDALDPVNQIMEESGRRARAEQSTKKTAKKKTAKKKTAKKKTKKKKTKKKKTKKK